MKPKTIWYLPMAVVDIVVAIVDIVEHPHLLQLAVIVAVVEGIVRGPVVVA